MPTHTTGEGLALLTDITVIGNPREITPIVEEYILNELAPSIAEHGLIQPVVLFLRTDGKWELIAGECRYRAFSALGYTHIPYVTQLPPDEERKLLLAMEENVRRHAMPFKDEILAIERIHRIRLGRGDTEGNWTISRTGKLLGVSHGHTVEALNTAKLISGGDKEISLCTSLREVRKILATRKVDLGAKVLQERHKLSLVSDVSPKPRIKLVSDGSPTLLTKSTVDGVEQPLPRHTVVLSDIALNQDCHEWFAQRTPESVDGIYTDIPYGISMADLAEQDGLERTIDAHDIDENISQFPRFIDGAFHVLKDKSYLLFFYALEHHNLLRDQLLAKGFTVQAWPCCWIKPVAKNQAPHCWFTKTMEWVMVARKGPASLLKPMTKNYHMASAAQESKVYSHPFYKAWDFSRWLLESIVIPGSTWVDNYAGEGSLGEILLEKQAKTILIEKSKLHYPRLLENLRRKIKQLLKGDVNFA